MTDELGYPEEIHERVQKGMGCWSGIGNGRYNLVRELDAKIAKIYPNYVVDQIKEKFGSLRYYIGAVPEEHCKEIYALINEAEAKSLKICEICGQSGNNIVINGWMIIIRCEEHTP